jgi:hypothetical protein
VPPVLPDVQQLGPQVGTRVPEVTLLDQKRQSRMLASLMGPKGRTARPAPAIGECLRPVASAASVPMRSISPNNRRHMRRPVDSFAAPSKRDGRFRSIAPVSPGRHPSTSPVGWRSHSTHRVIRRRIKNNGLLRALADYRGPSTVRSMTCPPNRAMSLSRWTHTRRWVHTNGPRCDPRCYLRPPHAV